MHKLHTFSMTKTTLIMMDQKIFKKTTNLWSRNPNYINSSADLIVCTPESLRLTCTN